MKRSRALKYLFASGLLTALLIVPRGPALAQGGLGNIDDATMVPQGQFRLQAISAWTRFDSRFLPAGSSKLTSPLGADFSFDSLGVAQLPALSGTQNAIQTLTGSPFRLSLGSTQAEADARVSVTPISVEYGLMRRLTLGVMLPLVRTRMNIMMRVNPTGTEGNVGLNPAGVNGTALASDSAVVQQLLNAAAALQATLQSCQANPASSPNCPGILARSQDATLLAASAAAFAATFGAVYGQNSQIRGAPLVPLAGSAADALVRARLATFDSSFQSFLNAGSAVTAVPAAAGGPLGTADLSNLLADPGIAGFDSLKTTVRIAPGDLELSARYLLFDGFADSTTATDPRAWHARATLTGTYRLPTGQLATASNPLDIATGRGTTSAEARFAMYGQWGTRVGVAASAGYVASFGKTATGAYPLAGGAVFPPSTSNAYPYTPGAVMSLEVAPRYMITRLLGLNAMYDYQHMNANDYGALAAQAAGAPAPTPIALVNGVAASPGTLQSVGFGITYSTVTAFERGGAALPIDITFTHLEAIRGADRMPKYFRDQIQIRFYYRRHQN